MSSAGLKPNSIMNSDSKQLTGTRYETSPSGNHENKPVKFRDQVQEIVEALHKEMKDKEKFKSTIALI